MEDTLMSSRIDFAEARAAFEVQDTSNTSKQQRGNVRTEDVEKHAPETSDVWWPGWSGLWEMWLSKWPGWPKFWKSRFSGWPIAFIFALYVYYLLVFVLLPTKVDTEVQKSTNESYVDPAIMSQIK